MIVKVKYRLSRKSIDRVLRLKEAIPPEPAATLTTHSGNEFESDEKLRRTEVRWIMRDQFPFIHEELITVVQDNRQRLRMDTNLFIERGVQLATYYPGDHYSWHEDGHPDDNTRRQLSISVLLSSDFTGGELEFKRSGAPQLKRPGDIVLFNSWETHRVKAVIRGVRDSLVVWFRTP